MMSRRKKGAAAPKRAERVRELAPAGVGARRYPTLGEALASPVFADALRVAVRGAAVVAALAAGGGCATPECQTSASAELTFHSEQALSSALRLDPADAATQLAIATGITPHPATLDMAGAESPVMPMPMPTPTTPVIVPAPTPPSVDGEMPAVAPATPIVPNPDPPSVPGGEG